MRPEAAAERAFEALAKEVAGAMLGSGPRVEEGAFTGALEPGSFPRLNFFAQGTGSEMAGSQRLIIVAEVRVWRQGGSKDGSQAKLREVDEALATALETAKVLYHSGFRIFVLSVGSFQTLPGAHANIRGRRRVYALQVVMGGVMQVAQPNPGDETPTIPAAFNFAQLRGVRAVYDAATLNLADGAAVAALVDASGHGVNLEAGAGGGPLFRTTVAAGVPVLEGNGIRGLVRLAVAGAAIASATECSIYLMFNGTWGAQAAYLIRWGVGIDTIHLLLTGGALSFKAGWTYHDALSAPLNPGPWPLIEAHKNGPNLTVFVNGGQVASTNNAVGINTAAVGTLSVGINTTGNDYGINGRLRHVCIAGVDHTENERAAIRAAYYAMRP